VGRLKKVLLLVLISTIFFKCERISKTKEIKLGHALNMSHPVHKAVERMAELVEEKSGGALTIKIYPNAQLGSERESIELLQIGSLGMTKVSTSVMESFAPNFKVFSLPYMFRDKEHYHKVLDGEIGQDLLDQGTKFWLKGLTYYDAGSRSFYTVDKPINEPDDLKGLQIRVQASPTSMSMVSALSGSPTPISWGELYTALQQGVVDGAENNPPSFHTSRHYEVAKYYSLNEHTMVPDVLLISTKVWDRLSEQEQQWVQEAALESVELQRKLWNEAEEEAMRVVEEAGVKVNKPDKKKFEERVRPIYENYRDEPEVYQLIQDIKSK
jgi:tripartite ATP-independent transporter DctP family solute receptor